MEMLDYRYCPKTDSISYKETSRDAGFTQNFIHMHDHNEINLIISDSLCEISNNGNRRTVQTPAMVIHRAGTFHEITRIPEGQYNSRLLFFHEGVLSGFPEKYIHTERILGADMLILPLTREQVQLFLPLFDQIRQRSGCFEQMLFLLLCVLSQIHQLLEQGSPYVADAVRETYIFDVVAALREDVEQRLTTSDLAERFHVSRTKLNSDFRRIAGMSVKTFSASVRLQKAMTLLQSTDEDLASIAYACGFSGESYFIEQFRKTYGETPGAFRKKR